MKTLSPISSTPLGEKNGVFNSVDTEKASIGEGGDKAQFGEYNEKEIYYVDSQTGSDDNYGSESEPFATVQYAFQQAKTDSRGRRPGDTADEDPMLVILVEPGHVEPSPVEVQGYVGRFELKGRDEATAITNQNNPPYIPVLKYKSLTVTDTWLAQNIKCDRLTVRGSTGGAIGNCHITGDSDDGYRDGALAFESADIDLYKDSQVAAANTVGTAHSNVNYGILCYRGRTRVQDIDVETGAEPKQLANARAGEIHFWDKTIVDNITTTESPKITTMEGGILAYGSRNFTQFVSDDDGALEARSASGLIRSIGDSGSVRGGIRLINSDEGTKWTLWNIGDRFELQNATGDVVIQQSQNSSTRLTNGFQASSSPPSDASAAATYFDDGTNTGDGNPGWRYTDDGGATWTDVP